MPKIILKGKGTPAELIALLDALNDQNGLNKPNSMVKCPCLDGTHRFPDQKSAKIYSYLDEMLDDMDILTTPDDRKIIKSYAIRIANSGL